VDALPLVIRAVRPGLADACGQPAPRPDTSRRRALWWLVITAPATLVPGLDLLEVAT
jgi:hypothetical protein